MRCTRPDTGPAASLVPGEEAAAAKKGNKEDRDSLNTGEPPLAVQEEKRGDREERQQWRRSEKKERERGSQGRAEDREKKGREERQGERKPGGTILVTHRAAPAEKGCGRCRYGSAQSMPECCPALAPVRLRPLPRLLRLDGTQLAGIL